MSHNFPDGKSLNACTPKEKCTVKYRDLDYAVRTFLELQREILWKSENDSENEKNHDETKPGHKTKRKWKEEYEECSHKRKTVIFSAKSDLKSAFCILGLSKASWKWLIMKAEDLNTGEWCYFMDKCLPFGASISFALFQCFSNTLCHLIEFRLKVNRRVTNYLDDFLFIAISLLKCNFMVKNFLDLCSEIGIPVSLDKTEWASELTVFLGILLDSRHFILAVPKEKLECAIDMLNEISQKTRSWSMTYKSFVVF